MRILVLDGNENQAVACVRSLAHAGHKVMVGATSSWSKAAWSRSCDSTFHYLSPEEEPDIFVEQVAEETARTPGTLVLPMTERTTLPLSLQRARIFAAGGRLVLPPHETVLQAFDKQQMIKLAGSLGIAVPQTSLLADRKEARDFALEARYPLVLKPRSSEEILPDGRVRATSQPLYASNSQQFLACFDELRRRCSSVLAQEYVAGRGTGYFALMSNGECLAEFAHKRIRDVRPTGSGSAVRESIKPPAAVRQAGLAILKELRWHGVAMVEFRVTSDGTPVLMEVNGRFWNSLPLAVYAGVDFAALLAQLVEQGDLKKGPSEYREGVRCRWLLGDFRHLLEVWRGAPLGFPGAYPNRIRTLLDFLKPVRGTYHDNFQLTDPLPELGDWLDFAFRRLPARLKKRSTAGRDINVQRGYSLP